MDLRLQVCRGHLLTSLAVSALFFLLSAKWLPLVSTGQGSALFLSSAAAGTCSINQGPTGTSSYLGNAILQALVHCQLISATPRAEFRQREETVSGVLLGAWSVSRLLNLMPDEGCPTAFWKWELSALQAVFKRSDSQQTHFQCPTAYRPHPALLSRLEEIATGASPGEAGERGSLQFPAHRHSNLTFCWLDHSGIFH